MNPGDVRTIQQGNGNAAVLGVGLWAEKHNTWIQIHVTGVDGVDATVSNNPESVRYHRMLFRDLRRALLEQDCWPFGDEGRETEEEERPSRFNPVAIRGKPLSATIIEDRGER
jgi:hypothetical protein